MWEFLILFLQLFCKFLNYIKIVKKGIYITDIHMYKYTYTCVCLLNSMAVTFVSEKHELFSVKFEMVILILKNKPSAVIIPPTLYSSDLIVV